MAGALIPYDRLRFTRNERLPDRFLVSEVHTVDNKGSRCLLVTTLEIPNQWHHAREYAQQIISTIVREYSRSQSASGLMKFEQALKFANHTIKQAKEKLNTDINCSVALFLGEEVHFAVLGKARLLLFRSGRLIDVAAEEETEHEEFSSVTSGDLSEGEWLLSVNDDFASYLKGLGNEIWKESDLDVIAAQIIELAPAENRDNFAGTLLHYQPDKQVREQVVYWNSLEHVTPIKLPNFELPQFDATGFLSKITAAIRRLVQAIGSLLGAAKTRLLAQKDRPRPSVKLPSFSAPKLKLNWQFVALIIFLILVVTGSSIFIKRVRAPKTEAKPTTLVEELIATSVGQRAAFLASQFKYEDYQNLDEAGKKAFAQALAADNITAVEPNELVSELPDQIAALDGVADQIFAVDKKGQLWRLSNSKAVKVQQSLLIQEPTSVAALSSERIVVSDAAGNLWLFDNTAAQPTALALPSQLASNPKTVQKYTNNLYISEGGGKSIYRVANFDKDISSTRTAVKAELVPTPLADWSINGDVIMLGQNGTVTFVRANKNIGTSFQVESGGSLRVAANEKSDRIFVYGEPFLKAADREGNLIQTLFPISKDKLADVYIDETGHTLWIAFGKQIYRLAF